MQMIKIDDDLETTLLQLELCVQAARKAVAAHNERRSKKVAVTLKHRALAISIMIENFKGMVRVAEADELDRGVDESEMPEAFKGMETEIKDRYDALCGNDVSADAKGSSDGGSDGGEESDFIKHNKEVLRKFGSDLLDKDRKYTWSILMAGNRNARLFNGYIPKDSLPEVKLNLDRISLDILELTKDSGIFRKIREMEGEED